MSFKFSEKSLKNLEGVDKRLVDVVSRALEITKIDFMVIEGLRTEETQRAYVLAGKSQTMDSRHLCGKAVDLMVYVLGKPSWELNLYDDIADAMKEAAIELEVPIRWGGAWTVKDIRHWQNSMASAMNSYIDERRAQCRKPFIDGPHFELTN